MTKIQMQHGVKTRIRVNDAQADFLFQCCRSSDYVYNYALNEYSSILLPSDGGDGRYPDISKEIRTKFNAEKTDVCPWILDFPYEAVIGETFRNFQKAINNYWRQKKDKTVSKRIALMKKNGTLGKHVSKRRKGAIGKAIKQRELAILKRRYSVSATRQRLKSALNGRRPHIVTQKELRRRLWSWDLRLDPGYPQRKKKFSSSHSFTFYPVTIKNGRVRLPASRSKTALHKRLGIDRWVVLAEKDIVPDGAKVSSATVSLDGGQWYISFLVSYETDAPTPVSLSDLTTGDVLGVDAGARYLAVDSDGEFYANPKAFKRYSRRMALLQQELEKRQKGSNNWKKTKAKINKLHAKIKRVRHHHLHNTSAAIVKKGNPVIGLEDLNIDGMMRKPSPKPDEEKEGHFSPNGRSAKRGLSRTLADAGMGELHRQIKYKSEWTGVHVHNVDRYYPSSKECPECKAINKDLGSSEEFVCPNCGFTIHRDVGGAVSIKMQTCADLGITDNT